MNALLLSAGFGTRLRPLTDHVPKCLVPIGGRPLLEIWLEKLAKVGVQRIVVNTHYLADQVVEFIARSAYRDRVTIVHEVTLLGTAGTLMANLHHLAGSDCFLIHADNYTDAPMDGLIEAHRRRAAACCMTMQTFRTTQPSQCGIVEVDSAGIAFAFHEKVAQPPSNLANGAVYILSSAMLDELSANGQNYTDFSNDVIPRYLRRIQTVETAATFLDIGTPESYTKACRLAGE